jgi:hypothetical protein
MYRPFDTASFFVGQWGPRLFQDKIDCWLSSQGPGLKIQAIGWESLTGSPFLQVVYSDSGLVRKSKRTRPQPLSCDPQVGYPNVSSEHLKDYPTPYRARVLSGTTETMVRSFLNEYQKQVPEHQLFHTTPMRLGGDLWIAVVIYETSVIRLRFNFQQEGQLAIVGRGGIRLDDLLASGELENRRPDVLTCQNGAEINLDIGLPVVPLPAYGGLQSDFFFGSELDVKAWVATRLKIATITVSNPAQCVPLSLWYAFAVQPKRPPVIGFN